MDAVRLNLSHGSLDDALAVHERVRKLAAEAGRYIGTLVDLPGPKVRAASFGKEGVDLADGAIVRLVPGTERSTAEVIEISYDELLARIEPGDRLSFGDGAIDCEVVDKDQGGLQRQDGPRRSRVGSARCAHPLRPPAHQHPHPRGPAHPRRLRRGRRGHGGGVLRALRPRRAPGRDRALPARPAGRRQDRDPRRHRQPGRHHRGVGRGDDRPRRPGQRVLDRGAAPPPEAHHPRVHRPQPARHHRHPDAGVDDPRRRRRPGPRPPTSPTPSSTARRS